MNYLMDASATEAFINSGGDDVAYIGRLTTAWDGRGFRTDKPLDDDEWQRLINLVAAAPDLLAALKDVCRFESVIEGMNPSAWPVIHAAIAKAEGRAA